MTFANRFLSSYSVFLHKPQSTSRAMQNSRIYALDFLLPVLGGFDLGLDSYDNQGDAST